MIALVNFDKQPTNIEDVCKLIKLNRQLKPQSTSREIDDEAFVNNTCVRDNDDAGVNR